VILGCDLSRLLCHPGLAAFDGRRLDLAPGVRLDSVLRFHQGPMILDFLVPHGEEAKHNYNPIKIV